MTSAAPQVLKVLHVCPRPLFSGLEAYALATAEGQKKLGHDVSFVVLPGSPLEERCLRAGLKTMQMTPDFRGRMNFVLRLTKLLISTDAPDLLHLHSTQDLDLVLPAMVAAKVASAKTRLVLQTHIWISHSKRDPLHAFSYSFVDEVWCGSVPAKKTLERFLPIAKSRIRVLNYGREVAKMESEFLSREAARDRLALPQDAIVVGTVARIDEGKGTRELLEGTLLEMAHEPRLHLILIGPPTADDPRAVAYAEKLHDRIANLPADLKSRVHAPGAVAESYRLLKAFDLFALPTYSECFALSLLEALLAGIPCLSSNSGGSPEVVREGETGWLFEPRSVESLHQCLARALRERHLWPQYGENGRKRVQRDFDFPKVLPTTVTAYREILANP